MCDGDPDCDNEADEEFSLCNPEGRLIINFGAMIINPRRMREGYGSRSVCK